MHPRPSPSSSSSFSLGLLIAVALLMTPGCRRGKSSGDAPIRAGLNREVAFAKQLSLPRGFFFGTAADVDGDGDLDLFGTIGARLTLLINSSVGFIDASQQLPGSILTETPRMSAGDIDGDGDQDLAVARTKSGRGRLLINDGKGKFSDASAALPPRLTHPYFNADVALADFDGDGKADLFQGNRYSTFSPTRIAPPDLLLSNYDRGRFGRSTQFRWTSTVRVSVADVNGDGKPDVVRGMLGNCETTCDVGEAPDVLLSDGRGGFTKKSLLVNGFWCDFIHAMDLDSNGRIDIVTSGRWRNEFPRSYIVEWDGKGAFVQKHYDESTSFNMVADIDGDGDGEILTTAAWWIDNGRGGFKIKDYFGGAVHGSADVDGDGDVDVIGDAVLLNNGTGRFTGAIAVVPIPWRTGSLLDIDGDGFRDFFGAMDRGATSPGIYWNDGRGSLRPHVFGVGVDEIGAADVGDIDADGDVDVFARIEWSGKKHAVWLEQTSPRWFVRRWSSPETKSIEGLSSLIDLDGDKDLDAVEIVGGSTTAWRNDGSKFTAVAWTPQQASASDLVVFDANGDGRRDLYVANEAGFDRLWLASATGPMIDASGRLGRVSKTSDVVAGDIDGDGDVDLIIGSSGNPSLRALLNQGRGTFADAGSGVLPQVGGGTRRIALADLQEDGDLDLVRVSSQGLEVYLNDRGRFVEDQRLRAPLQHSPGPLGLVAGDLDGDLDVDFLISAGTYAYVLRNAQRDLDVSHVPIAGELWQLDIRVNPSSRGLGRAFTMWIGGARRDRALAIPEFGLWSLPANAAALPSVPVPTNGYRRLRLPIPTSLLGAEISVQALIQHGSGHRRLRLSNAINSRVSRPSSR